MPRNELATQRDLTFMTNLPAPIDGNAEYPTIFREFLYADIERTRSLFAQRLGGIPEEDRVTDSVFRHYALGVQRYLGAGKETRSEHYEQRSLLDALFPALENLLEIEGWLTDISDIVHDDKSDDPGVLKNTVEPGSIVRLTARGTLFDAEFVARILAGVSVAADGISTFANPAQPNTGQPKQKPKGQRGKPEPQAPTKTPQLEDLIEDFPPEIMDGLPADFLRSMVRVARGMFPNGLYLLLEGDGGVDWTATARLQKGRQYLEAEPDILFSRYGTAPHDWTIVGTVGYFAEPSDSHMLESVDFTNDDESVSRTKFVTGLNALTTTVANLGFADSPAFPGFTIIPLAVYRTIPQAKG